MGEFVHLHNHSDYSLLDGAVTIDGLVEMAKKYEMKHLALTDHGNLFGSLRFEKACRKEGINPIYVKMRLDLKTLRLLYPKHILMGSTINLELMMNF